MDWTTILTTLAGLLLGGGGSVLYFRPKLKEAKIDADKAENDYLQQRIDAMEKLYNAQGKILDDVRQKLLDMGKEMQSKDERINQLESENRTLKSKMSKLEKELANYQSKTK